MIQFSAYLAEKSKAVSRNSRDELVEALNHGHGVPKWALGVCLPRRLPITVTGQRLPASQKSFHEK